MTATITAPFSEYNREVKDLVREHSELEETHLILALRYQPKRNTGDIFLFEVLNNFGAGLVSEKQTLFELTLDAEEEFPMRDGKHLHIVLTNPKELEVALKERWPLAQEVLQAVREKKYEPLFSDAEGKRLLERLLA